MGSLVSAFDISSSTTNSLQKGTAFLSQQYSGTCNINCNNTISDVSIDLIDSNVPGGISFNQSCSVNSNCVIGNTSTAISDIMFNATNSSNADVPSSVASLGDINLTTSNSVQTMDQTIIQGASQSCGLTSANDINNVSVFAEGSNIGAISFNQTGNTSGGCTLNNTMNATAYASGISNNTATSGSDKCAACTSKKSKTASVITMVIVGLIVIIVVFMIAKLITHKAKSSNCPDGFPPMVNDKGKAYCPPRCMDGSTPLTDSSGKPFCPPLEREALNGTGGPMRPRESILSSAGRVLPYVEEAGSRILPYAEDAARFVREVPIVP
jgi:hypothetical protein